jgi:hypothetical protein
MGAYATSSGNFLTTEQKRQGSDHVFNLIKGRPPAIKGAFPAYAASGVWLVEAEPAIRAAAAASDHGEVVLAMLEAMDLEFGTSGGTEVSALSAIVPRVSADGIPEELVSLYSRWKEALMRCPASHAVRTSEQMGREP